MNILKFCICQEITTHINTLIVKYYTFNLTFSYFSIIYYLLGHLQFFATISLHMKSQNIRISRVLSYFPVFILVPLDKF